MPKAWIKIQDQWSMWMNYSHWHADCTAQHTVRHAIASNCAGWVLVKSTIASSLRNRGNCLSFVPPNSIALLDPFDGALFFMGLDTPCYDIF
ncbi:hypothetical protein GBA52_021912 [Prunus armeniaca]|nr:hypothetical protein GBA52_021912 [Prunus armeniaca]